MDVNAPPVSECRFRATLSQLEKGQGFFTRGNHAPRERQTTVEQKLKNHRA